jgi:hypothetical protein
MCSECTLGGAVRKHSIFSNRRSAVLAFHDLFDRECSAGFAVIQQNKAARKTWRACSAACARVDVFRGMGRQSACDAVQIVRLQEPQLRGTGIEYRRSDATAHGPRET